MFDPEAFEPARPTEPLPRLRRPAVAQRVASWAAAAFLLALIVSLVTLYAGPSLIGRWRTADAQAEAEAAYLKRQAELKAESEAADRRLATLDSKVKLISLGFREVVRKVGPSVVNVSNEREVPREWAQQLRKESMFYDYNKDRMYAEVGVGSGLLVQPEMVLTNNHVVKDAQRLRVSFLSGDWVAVEVKTPSQDPAAWTVATDPLTDLAVIRLPAGKVKETFQVSATFADSDKDVQVGDWALAVGSPLGLEQTVTAGIISHKGRVLSNLDMVEVLQTDAAINPGNSGGPLFDQYGRVVGINVAIASKSGGNQGIGFAIPSNTAKDIWQKLADHGEVTRGYLGVGLQELPFTQVENLKIADTGGILINQVQPQQPAAQAGFEKGDVIVRFNGQAVGVGNPMKTLRKLILDCKPGQSVEVELVREGSHFKKSVTVGKRPPLP
jgi:serine protease Do